MVDKGLNHEYNEENLLEALKERIKSILSTVGGQKNPRPICTYAGKQDTKAGLYADRVACGYVHHLINHGYFTARIQQNTASGTLDDEHEQHETDYLHNESFRLGQR